MNDHNPTNIYRFKFKKRNSGEKECNMLEVNSKNARTTLIDVVLVSLLLTLNTVDTFFRVSIVDSEYLCAGDLHGQI